MSDKHKGWAIYLARCARNQKPLAKKARADLDGIVGVLSQVARDLGEDPQRGTREMKVRALSLLGLSEEEIAYQVKED